MLICLVSAKGSPGVTTTAAALVAVASGRGLLAMLAELDPSGGDIEALSNVPGEPGLLQAAANLRRIADPEALLSHVVTAPAGVASLLAPMSGPVATATIASALDHWGPALATLDGVVVADAGRWEQTQTTSERILGSDVLAVVCRPDARAVEHVRHLVDQLRQLVRPVLLVTVGERPYPLEEIAAALEVRPAGTIAWDPKGAAALWAGAARRRRTGSWRASHLARSAQPVLDELLAAAGVRAR